MRKSSLFALCLFSFVSAFFISCEVGLGKAVDTSAPSVEIEAPEADFIVREKFVMSGVCSDDQGVVSIKVSLLNTTTHKSYGPFDAKLGRQNDSSETGEKSGLWKCDWTCEINPLDDNAPIPDGDYEATATAKDAYGHSTTGKKSFTIDNTPPLLVLTRPSTKVATDGSAQNFDTYGAEFDITGQVADDSNIDKLVVSVFSDAECKNLLTDIELKNVPPTIELSAAKWGAEESDELYGFYEKIYGSEKAGTKQFYCTVTVYDEARRCPSVENDEGNSRTAYYLYKDIYSALLNKYKVTELYHILNGSYDAEENSSSKNATSASNSSAFSVEKIAEEVNAILDSFETKAGSFTLNPENSPTFTLSGFDSFDLIDAKNSSEEYQKITEDDSGFGLLNGSAVTVKFSAGLDKSPLVEESLGFYLVPWIQNEDKTWSADLNDKIWIIRPYEKDSAGNYISEIDVSDFESGKQTEAKKYYENARGNLATVGSYDFTATMNIASSNLLHIKTGIVYELKAVGCDENGNSFLNDSRYGFYLESSGLAPSISVTEIDGKTAKSNWYVASGKSMKIKGTVSAEDKTSIKIKVTDDAKNTVAFEGEEIVCESSDSPVAESWELEIPNKYFASTKDSGGKPVSSNYTVNITATCGTRSTEKEISVGYDVEGPEIEIASVLPYASLLADESSGKNIYTVNGKFSVKVRASDSFYKLSETENIVLQIFDSDNPGNKNPVYYFDSSSSNFEKEIDSRSDLKDFDKHNLKIVVTAYDYAGNKSEVEQQIYLYQDTDKPVVNLTNATKEGYENKYPENATGNAFLSGAPITATVSDDDGIESIVVNIYESPFKIGDNPIEKHTKTISAKEITSNPYPLSFEVPSESEEFMAEIIVTDTENGTKNDLCRFYFMVDSGAPSIVVYENSNGKYFGKPKGTIHITGKISGLGGFTIYREYDEKSAKGVKISGTQPDATQLEYNWEDYFQVPEDLAEDAKKQTNKYYVIDKKGRAGIASLDYYVDATKPTVKITTNDTLVEDKIFKFAGTSDDKDGKNPSGISSRWYKLQKAFEATPAIPDSESYAEQNGWIRISGETSAWNFTKEFTDDKNNVTKEILSEGEYILYVCAYDVAGNVSDSESHSFAVDLNKPEIKTFYAIDDSETEILDTNAIDIKKSYSFIYKISDSYGLAKENSAIVKITRDGTEISSDEYDISESGVNTSESVSGESFTGKITIKNQIDGTYIYTITAKDVKEKTSSVTRTVVYDKTPPAITVISPSNDNDWITTSSISVKGSADDTSGVAAVYCTDDVSKKVPEADVLKSKSWTNSGWEKLSGTSNWSKSLKNLKEGTSTLYFVAVDVYGNVSEKTQRSVNYDAKEPSNYSVTYSLYDDSKKSYASAIKINSGDSVVTNKKFKISGTAKDSYKLDSIVVTAYQTENSSESSASSVEILNKTELSKDSAVTSYDWNAELPSDFADGKWKISVSVSDVSGQASSSSYTFTLDREKPTFADAKLFENSQTDSWYFATDKGLVSIGIADSCSGIDTAEYLVSTKTLTQVELSQAEFDGVLNAANGIYSKSVTFSQGKNFVYIKVKDAAGNINYYGTENNFYCNVDTEKPEITFVSPESGSYITDKEDLILTINLADKTSKFSEDSELALKISDDKIVSSKTYSAKTGASGGEIKITVPQTDIAEILENVSSSGGKISNFVFTATVTDNASLSASENATVNIDNIAPTLVVNNPVETKSDAENGGIVNTEINGKIKINGTSYDEVGVDSVEVYRTLFSTETLDSEDVVDIVSLKAEHSGKYIKLASWGNDNNSRYNWNVEFNTKDYNDGENVKFLVIAKDSAGNKSEVIRQTVINQDADRPVITFNNVTLNSDMSDSNRITHQQDTIYGTVKDDDGIASVKIATLEDSEKTGFDWDNVNESYSNGAWSYDFGDSDGEKTLVFRIVDTEGSEFYSNPKGTDKLACPKFSDNAKIFSEISNTTLYLVVDRENPVINGTFWKIGDIGSSTKLSDKSSFITNSSKITLNGTVSDTYKVASVVLKGKRAASKGNETAQVEVELLNKPIGSSNGTWEKEFVSGSQSASSEQYKLEDGEWTFTLAVSDGVGKTVTQTFTAIIDTVSPTATNTLSASSSDDKSAISDNGTWHSSAKPILTVLPADATSGIAAVYYMVDNNPETPLDSANLKNQTIDSPLTKSGDTYSREISLNEGENYIYIKVEDNAGNFAYYGASDNGGSITWFVDKTGPVITFYAPNTSSDKKFSSKVEQAYEISVTDEKSGINESAEATLTLSSTSATITKTAVVSRASTTGGSSTAGGNSSVAGSSSSGGIFTVKGTFSAEEMSKITDNDATLTVSLKDACGNERTEKLTLTFDNEAPGVKIANPPSETVNGKITISGTSTDNVSVENVKLYRAKLSSDTDTSVIDHIEITENGNKTSVEAVLLQTFEGASAYNWSYSYQENGGTVSTFDTTKFSDGSAITLYAVALDTAGNTKTESKTLTVDQDADRPEIKFTNLTLNGMSSSKSIMNKNETIFGTVQDDDGVNEMFVSVDGGKTWSENIYDSGSWKYTFTEDESYKLEFKVIDSENREFVSGSGSDKMLSSPKLYDGSGNKFGYKNAGGTYSSDSDTYVYLQTDTQNPVINSVYYIVSENELSFSDDEIKNYKTSSSEAKKWQDKSNLSSFGGKYKYLYWLVDSQDASGISSVSASLGGTDLTLSDSVAASETEKITVFKFDASSLVLVNSNLSVSYSVTDKAERKTSGEHNVRVDNAAPTIEIKSHKNNAQVYGSSSVNVKGIADDCEKLYVKVTDSSTTPDANFGSDAADKTQWERIDEYTSTGSWSILFGSGTNTASSIDYYSKEGTLNGYYDKLFSPKSSEKTAGTKDMCIWLYGEDSLGNVSEPVKLALNVNPQGDQPNVSVSYPELSSDSKLTSVGGTIRITGSTSLGTSSDVTVDSVWIQIDPSYDKDAGFSSDWETELSSLMQAGGISETDYKIEPSGISEVGNAIKAKGSTSSWNLTINASREFNPADNKNRTMAIRVYAYSSSNKVSNPVVVPFELDPNSPVIGGTKAVSLVQYDKDGKTVIREMPYSNNMWISGIWYLVGSAEDDSGISELKLNGESIIGDTSKLTVADDISSSTTCRNYYFSIPVGSETENAVGTLQYTLNATEGSADAKYTENTFSFQYDNKAPELKATDAGYKTELSSSGIKIIQSNGTYTVYGTLNEDTVSSSNQSGFSRVLMFFTRTLNGKNYVVDPMISSGSTGMENALDISALGLETKNGIYWKSYTISSTNSNVLALSEELSKSVRIGGICRIDDIDYRISSIDYTSKTVTLDSSPSVSSSTTVAYFAIAQVIDNTSYENGTTSAFDFDRADSMSNADGDQMVEGVSQSGTTWKWSASIDSSLILDGAITMNFVAFDQAGNVSSVKQYSGTVSNNAPRIAGVMFGNDDDNNGTVDEDELVKTYSMIYTSLNNGGIRNGYISANQIADDVVIPSQVSGGTYIDALNIKGSFLVRPEIVGGNHGIGYNYKVSRGGTDVYSVNDVVRLSSVHSSGDEVRSETSGTKLDDIEISLEEMVSKGISDGSNAVFDFTLWDYTDGAEQSASSSNQANSARLRIYANVALYDEESPTVQINPFYWNSKDSNSVFYKDGSAKGHIELEDDWKNAAGYDSNATSGEYDGDPKVSGTIKIEGTASDNAMLKELYLTVPGLITEKLVGEYVQDETTKAWSWKEKGDLDTDGFDCQIENTKFDNSSHSIKWTVTVNTERITNVAALDVSVQAKANDRGKLQYNSGKLSYAARTESGKESSATSESYKMDVVPYITGISTSLSSLKKSNPSVNNRTALGHYPVSSSENVTITGFNLKGATISDSATTANTVTLADSGSSISVANFTSGKIKATVNGISSLNNDNSNDSSGTYSLSESGATIGTTGNETIYKNYYYNRQPNGDNNNLLTDDVVLDVWEFNSEAAKPINGAIDQPIMKINPKDGNIGFAFANGSLFFSMGGKVGTRPETLYSAQYWMGSYDFFTSIGFAYDDLGNTYGTAAGGDCNAEEGDAWCFVTSRWGIGTQGQRGSYDGSNALRLERIGQIDDSSYIINKQRVKSPSFATAVHGTSTNVYLAYYDVMNDEIRFKQGTLSSSSKTEFGNFSDSATSSKGTTRAENVTYVNLLAGGNTGRNAGEYVSLGVVPGSSTDKDVVVAVWYDSTNRCLKYAYNTSPLSSANGANSGSEWTGVETVFTGEMASAGEYCEVIVDKDGGIHIAAYDPTNLSLVYAYKSSYNASGFTTCIVDGGYGVVGSNLTLDIAKVNNVWTPYIGYYATTCVKPKLAYKVSSATAASGTINDSFTGNWECAVVPTSYVIPLGSQGNNRMNVGVWKNSSTWVINNSTTGTASHNHSGTGYKATCNDTVYGNGTQNPVMGYAIKINGSSTYIETAQMK